MNHVNCSSRAATVSLLLALVLVTACSSEEPVSTAGSSLRAGEQSPLTLHSLSTQPWLITGGDVLLEIRSLEALPGPPLVAVNGIPVNGDPASARPEPVADNRWQVLLTGLPEGDSRISASLPDGTGTAQLMVTNYPLTGPIISGTHETPFHCQTEQFTLVGGDTLGPPLDADCQVTTRVDYVYYSSTDEAFRALPETADGTLPEDLAQTENYLGEAVPFVVRVETGTVNRAIYEIAMLHRPAEGRIDHFNRSPHWNGKLVYTHGGGCRSGWYQQGARTGGVMREGLFRQGYAVVSSSLNVFGQNCNDLLASETHIMVKERFIERYGVPVYTIATGASGGSYQSHQTADNYPGVFDGIIVAASFPDVTSATIFTLADARLLHYYFETVNPDSFTRAEQQAVAGFGSWGSIANLARGAARLDPLYETDVAPEEQGGEVSIEALEAQRYHAFNPDGVRATVYDHTVNVYGNFDGTRIARRPLDNVGVQYGLTALNGGAIDVRQFLDLNRDIGGFDHDMNHVPERHVADAEARRRALESGRILHGGGGLAATPMIDYRSYTDHVEGGDIHMIVHQFSTRQRLVAANGHAANHVMQIGGRWGFTAEEPDLGVLFQHMDSWLLAIRADTSASDAATRVVRNRPEALVDACWDNSGGEPVKIEQPQSYIGDSECNRLYPAYATPRHVAGAPLANDIVSCQLRPVTVADYALEFSAGEWRELQAVFPEGVCDWSQGDASLSSHQGTWKSFGPSVINRLY